MPHELNLLGLAHFAVVPQPLEQSSGHRLAVSLVARRSQNSSLTRAQPGSSPETLCTLNDENRIEQGIVLLALSA